MHLRQQSAGGMSRRDLIVRASGVYVAALGFTSFADTARAATSATTLTAKRRAIFVAATLSLAENPDLKEHAGLAHVRADVLAQRYVAETDEFRAHVDRAIDTIDDAAHGQYERRSRRDAYAQLTTGLRPPDEGGDAVLVSAIASTLELLRAQPSPDEARQIGPTLTYA